MIDKDPLLKAPKIRTENGVGVYTGFNSLNLQEIYAVEKYPAVRLQIARGWGKPIIVRLPGGELLASQYGHGKSSGNTVSAASTEEAALCRSKDDGVSWSRPRLLGIPGRVSQLSILKNGALIMAVEPGVLYQSLDEGDAWIRCRVDWRPSEEGSAGCELIFGETNGVIEMPDETLFCSCHITLAPG